MAASMIFKVGDKFSSIKELEEAIKNFETEQRVTYWRRDSRKLNAAPKHGANVPQNDIIQYYSLKYACIKGGKNHKSQSCGKRLNQKTFRNGCCSFVSFKATKDSQFLLVTAISTDHNHEVNDQTFQFFPKRRKLNNDETNEINNILKTRPNKKILQNHIMSSTGKKLTLKDIQNLEAKFKGPSKDLEEILNGITSRQDCTVEIITDDGNMLRGIYYQDEIMKQKFSDYPELIIADATYKLNLLRMPVFLQIVVDGNGETEIVSVFIIVSEDNDTLKCLLEKFKQHNEAWTKTKTVLTDKDMTERAVYKELMPDIDLQLCLFHVLKAMKREIHCEKLGIRIEEKNLCLEILLNIAYSKTEDEYQKNLQRLRDTRLQSVIDYFQHSWHDIRREWVIGLKESCHYGNNTSNRVESINQKLKQVIARFSNLETFFHDLELVISCLRQERDSRIANLLLKKSVSVFADGSPESLYTQSVTPMAFKIIAEQISQSTKVTIPRNDDDSVELISSMTGPVTVTVDTCSCKFVTFNNMPCRHIFAFRASKGLDLYTETVLAQRWKMDFYTSHSLATVRSATTHHDVSSTDNSEPHVEIPITALPPKRILSQHQKYKAAFSVCQQIATLASEVSMKKFNRRISVIRELVRLWEEDADVVVSRIDRDDNNDLPYAPEVHEVLEIHEPVTGSLSHTSTNIETDNEITQLNVLEIHEPVTGSLSHTSTNEITQLNVLEIHEPVTGSLSHTSTNIETDNEITQLNVLEIHEPVTDSLSHTTNIETDNEITQLNVLEIHEPVTGSQSHTSTNIETDNEITQLNPPSERKKPELELLSTFSKCTTSVDMPVPSTSSNISTSVPLSKIILPSKMKVRGRPKGNEQTAIGVPRKRSKSTATKPIPFSRKLPLEKDKYVLRWFVSGPAAEAATAGKILEKKDIKQIHQISHACREDDSAAVHRARKYFSAEGWKALTNILCQLTNMGWLCCVCKLDLDSNQLGCDSCLEWFHLECTGLKKTPKTKKWFCFKCRGRC